MVKSSNLKEKHQAVTAWVLLGKQGRDAADAGFDALAKILNEKDLCWMVRTFAVALAGRQQRLRARVGPHVFQEVVGVARVGVEDAAFGQLGARARSPVGSAVAPAWT